MWGALIAVGAKLVEGERKRKSYRQSAMVNELNARLALMKGESDAERARKIGAHTVSQIVTGYANAGVDVSQGSPLVMQSQAASEVELSAQNALIQARQRAANEMIDAQTLRDAGDAAIYGAIGGATQILMAQLETHEKINPGPVDKPKPTAPKPSGFTLGNAPSGGTHFKGTGSYYLGGKKERWF